MKCNWEFISTGGMQCTGCGAFSEVALPDRDCPGRPELVKALRTKKPCNCGKKRKLTQEEKDDWVRRLNDRKLDQIRKLKVI